MALISAVLHAEGIGLLRYLDDWLVLASSSEKAVRSRDVLLLQLCHDLKAMTNQQESNLNPRQVVTYLGMEIHSLVLKVFLTQKGIKTWCRW